MKRNRLERPRIIAGEFVLPNGRFFILEESYLKELYSEPQAISSYSN